MVRILAILGFHRLTKMNRRQLIDVKLDMSFTDKVSGKNTDRPKLQELIKYARSGDTVHVHSIDRLARNLVDLKQIIQTLVNKSVSVRFYKENLFFSKSSDNPMDNLLLSILGAFAEFERSIIKERQREGIRLAKESEHIGGEYRYYQRKKLLMLVKNRRENYQFL